MAKEPKQPPIFINHRKLDTEQAAERLAAALAGVFGKEQVFLDRPSIEPGTNWEERLEAAAKGAVVMLALIGKEWGAQDPKTWGSYLSDPMDWVRRELEWGLGAAAGQVVPVLVDGAMTPPREVLEKFGTLGKLPMTQGVQLRVREWEGDFERIVAHIRGRGVRVVETKTGELVASPSAAKGGQDVDDFQAYRQWLHARHDGVELKGVGSGDIKLPLDEVFVPLRLTRQARRRDGKAHDEFGSERDGRTSMAELVIETVFTADPEARHALLFGEPGTGKTTALRKLLLVCLKTPASILGIEHGAPGPLPVLLPLRRLREFGTERTMAEVIGLVLHEQDKNAFEPEIGARLWQRGHLLLLLDGFDEVASDGLYRDTAAWLRRELGRADVRSHRALVTCRTALEQTLAELDLGAGFCVLDFRKLDGAQCKEFVRKWYDAASRQLPKFPAHEATALAKRLTEALDSEDYASQSLKVLVSTPLLLSLLCVVALREGEMPRHRVTFYLRCLEVMLSKWRYSQHGEKALLELEDALAVLRELARGMHERRAREFRAGEFYKVVVPLRRSRNFAPLPQALLVWFVRETGLLVDIGENLYGFMHHSVQEYLCADAMALDRESATLATHALDPWWREVTLLHVALRDRGTFGPWCKALLTGKWWQDVDRVDLLRDALLDAHQPDLQPLLARLDAEPDEEASQVLRLLLDRTEAVVLAAAQGLARDSRPAIAAEAQRLIDRHAARQQAGQRCNVLVVADDALRGEATRLLRALRQEGLVPRWDGEREVGAVAWQDDIDAVLQCKAVLVLLGRGKSTLDPEVQDAVELLRSGDSVVAAVVTRARGKEQPWADALLRCHGGDMAAAVSWAVDQVGKLITGTITATARPAGTVVSARRGEVWVEQVTGMRFVWIEPGKFQMGSLKGDSDEKPIVPVSVRGFWLAETAVTNEQYGRFLIATSQPEPPTWRDKKYSGSEQPVVGVSWHDAKAFCAWLESKGAPGMRLPSEAEWEYAARAGTTTEYSFAEESELADHAWFAGNSGGRPHEVRGKKPNAWGLYDVHGNVWEWCEDAWSNTHQGNPGDGTARAGDGAALRVVRGGCWLNSARRCRSAYRLWFGPGFRSDELGFRPARSSPDPLTTSPAPCPKA